MLGSNKSSLLKAHLQNLGPDRYHGGSDSAYLPHMPKDAYWIDMAGVI